MRLIVSLLGELPFGVAILEPVSESSGFRYAFANDAYERHAPGATFGSQMQPLAGLPEPTADELEHIRDSAEVWYGYQPSAGDSSAGESRVIRMMQSFVSEQQRYLLDVLLDRRLPLMVNLAQALSEIAEERHSVDKTGAELVNASLFARVAGLASSSLTLQRICERTLAGMREEMEDLSTGAIYVLEDDETMLQPLAMFRERSDSEAQSEPLPVTDDTDAGKLVLHGYQLLTREQRVPEETASQQDPQGGTRWIALAIERRGRPLGVLELSFEGNGSFGHDEVRLYQGIAAILGNAIGNARSYEAEVLNARSADGIGRVLAASIRARSEEELGCECLTVVQELTGAYFAFLAGRSPDGVLTTIASSEMGWDGCEIPASFGHRDAWRLREPYSDILSRGETFTASNPHLRFHNSELPPQHPDLTSLMGVPLLDKEGQIFGVVALANRPGGFFQRERETVEGLAPAIVEAIERFRAERELSENARFADELNHIESIIHASLDFDTIVEEALRTGREALGAHSAALARYEPPNFRVTHGSGFEEEICGRVIPEDLEEYSVLAIRSKAPVLVRDAATDERVNSEHMRRYGAQAVMVIPLIVGGKAFGNVYYNFGKPRDFSDAEVRFALRLSLSLSLATENARLYETERTISNRLQEALLSLPDTVAGVEFAHAYYPATDTAKVGGDFYDIFELSYGNIGITIGDVAGKGVDAATLTSLVKNSIRAHASERGKTPAQIMQLTNEVLYKTTPVESFVTVFFGILDGRDGRFVYCNGGHPTAAVLRANAEVAKLSVTGPLLGALPDIHLEHGETTLGFDDTLFLYTDGLTEARRNGELYGEARLFAALAEAPDHRPRKLMHRVVADMMAYSRGKLRDDLALLVVKRDAEAQRHPQQAKFQY